MAKKKEAISTVLNRGAIVAKKTKKAPEQGAVSESKQKNIQSAQGNTSNAYGKPSKSTNPKLNHSTEFSRPTQPAFQLEQGIANPKKVPSLYDYDPMPVEYGYKEDKAARESKRAFTLRGQINARAEISISAGRCKGRNNVCVCFYAVTTHGLAVIAPTGSGQCNIYSCGFAVCLAASPEN